METGAAVVAVARTGWWWLSQLGIVVLPREAGPMNSNNLGFRRDYSPITTHYYWLEMSQNKETAVRNST
eukprot:scaffold142776_cov83-Attheya_sp.AAC.1